MSRFYITSDKDSHSKAIDLNSEAGLTLNGTQTKRGIYLGNYEKRAINSNTFLSFEDGDFVSTSGTLILDGSMGSSALTKIYDLFLESGAQAVRDRAFGHYAVVIGIADTIHVFGDPNSVYEIYYTTEDDWFVSNSLYLCGHSLEHRIIDRHGLYQRAVEYCEISDSTLYKNVSRLSGSEKVVIDIETQQLSIESLPLPKQPWDYKDTDIEEVLKEYTERTRSVFSQIASAADGIGIQATGGLDSRSVLAGILDQGVKPLITYGVGNSTLTNTKERDQEVAKEYAEQFNLDFYLMDWSGEYPIKLETWDDLFKRYGFRYHTYGATPNFYSEFSNGLPGDPELIMSGYGFGTFSNNYFWEDDSLTPITFEEVVSDIFTYSTVFDNESFPCKQNYLEELVLECENALSQLGVSIDTESPLDQNELTRLVQFLNGRPQSAYINIVNEFTFHLSPFATYNLGRPMIDFPPEYRRGERIRVKLIKEIYPDLTDITMYSGGTLMNITSTDELVPAEGRSIVELASSMLPKPILSLIRPVYQSVYPNAGQPEVDTEIFTADLDRLSEGGVISECFDLKHYDGDIRYSSRLVHYEHAIETIGYDNILRRQE